MEILNDTEITMPTLTWEKVFLKKNLDEISPFCGATDISVLDFR